MLLDVSTSGEKLYRAYRTHTDPIINLNDSVCVKTSLSTKRSGWHEVEMISYQIGKQLNIKRLYNPNSIIRVAL